MIFSLWFDNKNGRKHGMTMYRSWVCYDRYSFVSSYIPYFLPFYKYCLLQYIYIVALDEEISEDYSTAAEM